tara:strand:- start:268450 stop:271767 length:3318 start_codon:yes stop_codon:yes gene_type:complete
MRLICVLGCYAGVLCGISIGNSSLSAANHSASGTEASHPALRLTFDQAEAYVAAGDAIIKSVGPTSRDFTGMPDDNPALALDGNGDYVRVADTDDGRLDFRSGEAITIEAWVRIESIKSGQNVYIVGKGRTFLTDEKNNQNYALRLRGVGQTARVSFLFRSQADDTHPSEWHRWTSRIGFDPDNQWHHVAVRYTFGDPETIRGYVDGQVVAGSWDMGGATRRSPIVDDDEVWVGSSMGGNAGNSLRGAIDEIAIHRRHVPDADLIHRRRVIERPPILPIESVSTEHVTVTIHESLDSHRAWPARVDSAAMTYQQSAFGFSRIPTPYGQGGVRRDWNGTVMLTAAAMVYLPDKNLQWMLRAGGLSRLWIDDEIVLRTAPHVANTSGHGDVVAYAHDDPWLRPPRPGHHEQIIDHVHHRDGPIRVTLQTLIGGKDLRHDCGEIVLAYRTHRSEPWQVLDLDAPFPLTDADWNGYRDRLDVTIDVVDDKQRRDAAKDEDSYWKQRHDRAREFAATLPSTAHDSVDAFIDAKLAGANVLPSALVDDDALIRRLYLDCVGVIPTTKEIDAIKRRGGGRDAWVDHLLRDPRWADRWTPYWMDVLAENPNILKASLNNTGPFRWFLYDSMRDNVAFDRWVTTLVRMEGSARYGGPAGFGIATENDVPMAAKAHVITSAFLGINMKCARCHDAPYHDWTQSDLFSLSAMLANEPIVVPDTSSVPDEFFGSQSRDESLITVTLKPGEAVDAAWSLGDPITDGQWSDHPLGRDDQPRQRLAYQLTRPENQRFAETIVNRLWHQFLGEAIVEPVDDWEGASPSHPELLAFLAAELTSHDYDLKHVARLILKSNAYQRQSVDRPVTRDEEVRFFDAPRRRRMSAEQVVDSLHVAVGRAMDSDELTFDPEARMKPSALSSLGRPKRAWQFASLSNERDRPALSLPRAAAVCECLKAFGWKGTRQEPVNHRGDEANVLQPAMLSSGLLSIQLTRLTDSSDLTAECVGAKSPRELVEHLFARFLGRAPTKSERAQFVPLIRQGFSTRLLSSESLSETPVREPFVTWANHLNPEATTIRLREFDRLRGGPPATTRLTTEWRERVEDAVWALINTPEFQFIP